MSGHSKWATTKHRKGAAGQGAGEAFAKLIRQVEVAAREGGGDLNANATLRTMFQKARDASVPLDTIERAIKRGTGELDGVRYEAGHLRGLRARAAWRSSSRASPTTATAPAPRSAASSRGTAARWPSPARSPGSSSARASIEVARDVDEDRSWSSRIDAGAEDLDRRRRRLRR